jgi:hypothetical protein
MPLPRRQRRALHILSPPIFHTTARTHVLDELMLLLVVMLLLMLLLVLVLVLVLVLLVLVLVLVLLDPAGLIVWR